MQFVKHRCYAEFRNLVVMTRVVMLDVVMLDVVMLSDVAPPGQIYGAKLEAALESEKWFEFKYLRHASQGLHDFCSKNIWLDDILSK